MHSYLHTLHTMIYITNTTQQEIYAIELLFSRDIQLSFPTLGRYMQDVFLIMLTMQRYDWL